jgi:hypothetical protein
VNDAGYFRTADRAGAHAVMVWKKPTVDRWTRSRSVVAAAFSTWNFNRENQGSGFFLSGNATFLNYWDVQAQAIAFRPHLDDRLTRGGPSTWAPPAWSFYAYVSSDSRKRVGVQLNGSHSYDTAGGFDSGVGVSLDIRPATSLTISTGPQITRGHSIAQYVRTVVDPLAVGTYGSRYVFGDLGQTEVSMVTRVDLIFTPKASLQLYMQPLMSTGTYWNFKELARPGTIDFLVYAQNGSTLSYSPLPRVYTADPDGHGPAQPFSFGDPAFNFKSLRVNTIFRWEWRLGSALYVVWTQQREDLSNPGHFGLRRDISSMVGAPGNNVLAVKLAYWFTK